ncbi:TIGR00730 family Rossman fold protein [candidate division GN15 bacterium]|nr:TIGR00730 family Rossman fold protein [candidate division GN15 bacterium]
MAKKKTIDEDKAVARLKRATAYKVAYKDRDFLDSGYARPLRLQAELMKTELGMRHNRISSTIVVFGGTRIVEPAEARQKAKQAEAALKKRPKDPILKRRLKIARSIEEKSVFYDEAREFGRLVSTEEQNNEQNEYVIITGGGPGIMEAANRGAFEVGAKSAGLNITLPLEQEPNPYITPELCFQFHYFAIRKMHFLLRAKALVAFPGGYGTLDELFEALTLVQTQKTRSLPIVLFGEKFWRNLINFAYLVEQGTIAEEDIELFVFADKAADAWDYIKYFWQAKSFE